MFNECSSQQDSQILDFLRGGFLGQEVSDVWHKSILDLDVGVKDTEIKDGSFIPHYGAGGQSHDISGHRLMRFTR